MESFEEGEGLVKTKEEKREEAIMENWRTSEFYPMVMKALQTEIDTDYLKEAMMKATLEGNPMSDSEIATLARVQIQATLRIQNIQKTLE